MFPTLSDLTEAIFHVRIGMPFQTYGFILAMAFLTGGLILRSELKRKEREGLLPAREKEPASGGSTEVIHPYQHTWSILVVAVIAAIVGSKLFDIADNFGAFLQHPIRTLFSFHGFAFLGGFLVTVVVLIFYMRVVKLDWKVVIDATAPAIIAGYALGRMGCHLSGDGCWGIPNAWPLPDWLSWLPGWAWACHYPHNVINAGVPIPGCGGPHCMALDLPVFPTSLYESMMAMAIFGILWWLRRRIKPPVVLFGLFMVLYGIQRLAIEQIRINILHEVMGMYVSQAEILSGLMIMGGIAAMAVFGKDSKL